MNDMIAELGIIIPVYIFLVGLCVGSFLNVVILRGLSGENMVIARSKCPKCNNQLKWYMNIPLLSYIFLRGKCAFCKEKISIQYPIVELVTGVGFLIFYFNFGLTFKTLFMCIFLSFFIIIAVTDILEQVVLDIHCYLFFIIALIYSGFKIGDINIIQALIGAIFGFLIFELMARVGKLFLNHRIFGEGDSLIALGLGAIFGIKNMIILIPLSILIQAISSIPILAVKSLKENKKNLFLSYVLIFLSFFYILFVNAANFFENDLYIVSTFIVSIFLIWSLKNIISDIKDKKAKLENNLYQNESQESYILLPFGPAMIISAIICIFYIDNIKNAILNYLF